MTLQDPDRRPSSTARWRGIISAGKVPLVNDSDSWKEIALRWKLSASWPTPSTTISANKHLIFSTFPRPEGKTRIKFLVLRAQKNASSISGAVRQLVGSLNSSISILHMETLREQVD